MHIERHKLRELQYLQEDIAEYFTDENMISGETYWTCVEAVAIAKLAELRGEIVYEDEEESPQNQNWLLIPKKSQKKSRQKSDSKPFWSIMW